MGCGFVLKKIVADGGEELNGGERVLGKAVMFSPESAVISEWGLFLVMPKIIRRTFIFMLSGAGLSRNMSVFTQRFIWEFVLLIDGLRLVLLILFKY